MDVTSLLGRIGLVKVASVKELYFKAQEFQKDMVRLKKELYEEQERYKIAVDRLTAVNQDVEAFESTALASENQAAMAVARVQGLESEIAYLREQVSYHQNQAEKVSNGMMTRLGLLKDTVQGEQHEVVRKPLKSGRVPFAIAASRAASQRTKEYWLKKAGQTDPDETGTAGTTSTDTPTVSDKA